MKMDTLTQMRPPESVCELMAEWVTAVVRDQLVPTGIGRLVALALYQRHPFRKQSALLVRRYINVFICATHDQTDLKLKRRNVFSQSVLRANLAQVRAHQQQKKSTRTSSSNRSPTCCRRLREQSEILLWKQYSRLSKLKWESQWCFPPSTPPVEGLLISRIQNYWTGD